MPKLIGDYMLEQNRLMHAKGKWGGSGYKSAEQVAEYARWLGARTMLDYGCGRGTLKEAVEKLLPRDRLRIHEYDPAIEGKDRIKKSRYDLVTCTDVMEHVEEARVGRVLRHIDELSRLGAFLVIACRPANKTLPDGQNAHVTLRPSSWWIHQVSAMSWNIHRAKVKMRKEDAREEKEVVLWIDRA